MLETLETCSSSALLSPLFGLELLLADLKTAFSVQQYNGQLLSQSQAISCLPCPSAGIGPWTFAHEAIACDCGCFHMQ